MQSLNVDLGHKSYPIYIQNGLIDSLGTEIKKLYKNQDIWIITDSNVEGLHSAPLEESLKYAGFRIKKIVIKPGEGSKSLDTLNKVCSRMLESGINRGTLIITFGGGVVGDLGGFAASILLRGIPFIQVPTSLLAQIDSSIGGKVAIDTKYGKNLLGSFYHPEAVFIDPHLLKTLDNRILNDGMAEVIKYGAIRDENFFNSLLEYDTKEDLLSSMEDIIFTCCSIKKEIVEKDEKDVGERMLLNFGHTMGHAIEKCLNYEGYTHGEAVAEGMYAITKNSENLGITEKGTLKRLKEAIIKYNLPYEIPQLDMDMFMKTVGLDKKNIGKAMNIVLLKRIGHGFIKNIDAPLVDKYLKI